MTTTNPTGAQRIEIARRIALATCGALPGERARQGAETGALAVKHDASAGEDRWPAFVDGLSRNE